MPRLSVRLDLALLGQVVTDPRRLRDLSGSQLSELIDAAERARLLGWLLAQLDAQAVPLEPTVWLTDRLVAVRTRAGEYERAVRWEIDRIHRAFWNCSFPWVLLKGAAYVAMALPPGRGRRVADIDVLVPHEYVGDAEAALRQWGWEFGPLDSYDTRYYREWMHELPPMIHSERKSVVDLHHAILPRTSRLHPSSARLIERSVPLEGGGRVLCAAHMVLHTAAHLFHDGEITGAIRDLIDLDALLRVFSRDGCFWGDLVREGGALELTRPAYYGLRHASRWLGTPIGTEAAAAMRGWKPAAAVDRLMDLLVDRTLVGSSGSSAAAYALYVRSHWLRMPPQLLARHLMRKSVRRR